MKNKKGFTLIELLVVIGIIAALSVTVFVALDPAKRFKDARNARRMTDADTILAAVHQYVVDTGGSMPVGIGVGSSQIGTCAGCVDVATVLSSNKYLKTNPIDPQGSAASTGYTISKDANNLFTVGASLSEGTTIAISR